MMMTTLWLTTSVILMTASDTDAGVACVVANRASVVTVGDDQNDVAYGDVAGEDGEYVRVRADKRSDPPDI